MVWTLFSSLCMLKRAPLWPIKSCSCANSVQIPQLRFSVHSHEIKDNPFSPTAPCRLFDSPLPVDFARLSFQSVRQTQFRDCWTKSKTLYIYVWRLTGHRWSTWLAEGEHLQSEPNEKLHAAIFALWCQTCGRAAETFLLKNNDSHFFCLPRGFWLKLLVGPRVPKGAGRRQTQPKVL